MEWQGTCVNLVIPAKETLDDPLIYLVRILSIIEPEANTIRILNISLL